MRTRLTNTLALTLTLGAVGCSSDHHAANPDASVDAPAPMPDAPTHQDGVAAIPLKSLSGGYTAELKLGGQAFDVIVDTGSTTTAVADSTCTNCNVHPSYMSGGAMDLHQTATAQYGSGSWKGECFEDGAVMGTRASVALDFAAITSQTGFFQGPAGFEGILGLGPDGLLLPHTTSYLTKLVSTGMAGQIAFQLCPDSGTMWLGGFDPTKATGAPAFTNLSSQAPYYIVSVGQATMGSAMALTGSDFGPTIIDTGTTLTFVPAAVVTSVANAVKSSSGYAGVFGTQTIGDGACMMTTKTSAEIDQALPPLSLSFAGATTPIAIPATRSYLFDQGGGQYCFTFSDGSQLFGGQKVSLFGNTLLAGLLTVIDVDQHKIGFAAQTGCAQPPAAQRRPMIDRRPTFDPAAVAAIVQR